MTTPKTVNNILSVLNVLLKTAHEWEVIDRRPCAIKVVRTMMAEATFHSFEAFESLVQAARETDDTACLIVLLGGEAGLRCGEMMALEWRPQFGCRNAANQGLVEPAGRRRESNPRPKGLNRRILHACPHLKSRPRVKTRPKARRTSTRIFSCPRVGAARGHQPAALTSDPRSAG